MTLADRVIFRASLITIIGIGWGSVLVSVLMSP